LAGGGTLGQALALVHKLPSFKNMPASVHEMASGDVEIQRDIFSGFAMAIARGSDAHLCGAGAAI
jgi:hypothetical protein